MCKGSHRKVVPRGLGRSLHPLSQLAMQMLASFWRATWPTATLRQHGLALGLDKFSSSAHDCQSDVNKRPARESPCMLQALVRKCDELDTCLLIQGRAFADVHSRDSACRTCSAAVLGRSRFHISRDISTWRKVQASAPNSNH